MLSSLLWLFAVLPSHFCDLGKQVVQMKKYQKEQEDIKHIKEFIASCGRWGQSSIVTHSVCA